MADNVYWKIKYDVVSTDNNYIVLAFLGHYNKILDFVFVTF